jgi:hypothetical protein
MSAPIFQKPRQSIAGFPVGIIVADEEMVLLPGNVANARTFDFPVMYEVLEGVGARRVMAGDPEIGELVVEAGERLIRRGVRAVTGACGSFANYQQLVASRLEVPVFLSVMLQIPMILSGLRKDQKVGVIAASAAALTPTVFDQCGINDPDRLVIEGAMQFDSLMQMASYIQDFDSQQLSDDLCGLAADMVRNHPEIAAFVLQCSDLPPFASAIQQTVPLPIYDMTSLVEWAARACHRMQYLNQ